MSQNNYGNPPPMGNEFIGQLYGVAPMPPQDPPMREFRNASLALPMNMKKRFEVAADKPLMGMAVLMPSPGICRMIGAAGYDMVFLDMEHTPMSIEQCTEYIRWINYSSEGTTGVLVRIPNFEHHYVAWVLDAGAAGVIVPHSETAEQARKMVNAARFPTAGGHRSYPPLAVVPGYNDGAEPGKVPFDVWNQHAVVIMQIESQLGCDNAEEIASVPGVDGLMIGMADLRFDLKLIPSLDGPEEIYNTCVQKVLKAGRGHNLPILSFTSGKEMVEKRLRQGFGGLILGAEGYVLAQGLRDILVESRGIGKALQEEVGGNEKHVA